MKYFFHKPYIYLLIVAIGIGLKFYKLSDRFFWDDEIATILHTSGISMADYEANIPVNQIFSRSYYDKILKLNKRDLKIHEQFIGLTKMPQLTPGHYYYLIFWVRLFGDGYMSYRYFSLFVFLISLPFFFLLAKKLFSSSQTAWIVISLYVVSPFFQVYAQESRYYILWALAMVAMHYIFLEVCSRQTKQWWAAYIGVGFFAAHTTILFVLIFVIHLVYYLRFYRTRWKPFILSLGLIFIGTLPWLIYIFINRADIQQSLSWQTSFGAPGLHTLLLLQLNGLIGVLYDIKFPALHGAPLLLIQIAITSLLVMSLFLLAKASKKQVWFVVLSLFVGIVFISTMDLVRGSITSYLPRYLLINYIGFLLLLAYVGNYLLKKHTRAFVLFFTIAILAGGVSSVHLSNERCAYNREDSYYHLEDAKQLFSGDERILIISDYKLIMPHSYTMFMSLIHWSPNQNIDLIYAKSDYPNFASEFNLATYDKIYAMYISEGLTEQLMMNFGDRFELLKDRKLFGRPVPVYKIIK